MSGSIKEIFGDIMTRNRNRDLRKRLIKEGKINPTDEDRRLGLVGNERVPNTGEDRGLRKRARQAGILQAARR